MTDHSQDERDRADRLLDTHFLDRLRDLADDVLLAARDDAVEEEDRISYVRRLLQGRLDLLVFEKQRRAGLQSAEPELGSGGDDRAMAKALAKVLTAPPTGGLPVIRPGGAAPNGEPVSVSRHRRAAEAAASDVRVSDPKKLDDEELAAALERIAVFESEVSVNRRRLQHVADALLEEVARRVEAGVLPAGQLPAGAHGDTPSSFPR